MNKIILCILLFLLPVGLSAQNEQVGILEQANELYESGRFEETIELLTNRFQKLSKSERANGYRLLALSYMYLDRDDEMRQYATQLMIEEPNYRNSADPRRFQVLIHNLGRQAITIETASQQAENIEESPVPTMLITEDMIKASGARTLQDLLAMYVPGFNVVESLGSNIAVRSTYSSNQETVLVLLNGMKLNSASNNTESLNYRSSLDKIARIEVLRGPASSLYGGVALSAVVNIITKRGNAIDGHEAHVTAGSFGTKGGGVLTGFGNMSQDITLWANVTSITGEKRELEGTTHYLGGYNNKPSFDVGFRGQWKDLTAQLTLQHSKYVPYYNYVDIYDDYTYDKYDKQDGEKPGSYRTAAHGQLSWEHTWNNTFLKVSAQIDNESSGLYNVMGDYIDLDLYQHIIYMLQLENRVEAVGNGVFQVMKWSDVNLTGSVQGGATYKWGKQHGTLMGGMTYEHFNTTEGKLMVGGDYDLINSTLTSLNPDSKEQTFSGFAQVKHFFNDKLILNGGVRYDLKERFDHHHESNISPRFALIFLPSKNNTLRLGYSHSFVDAPFLYRASYLTFISGSDLEPEQMDCFQLGGQKTWEKNSLTYDWNLFYNTVSNLVVANPKFNEFGLLLHSMENSGAMKVVGMEHSISHKTDRRLLTANLTWQIPTHTNGFNSGSHYISNIPKLTLNAVAAYRLNKKAGRQNFWVRGNVHVQSSERLSSANMLLTYAGIEQPDDHQNAKVIANAGGDYEFRFMSLSLDIYNLLNTNYRVGGFLKDAVPQQSRSIIGKIKVKF